MAKRVLATRGKWLINALTPKAATTTMVQSRIKVYLKAGTDIRLVYSHHGGVGTDPTTNLTITASIEEWISDVSTAGTIHRAQTSLGSYSATLTPGTFAYEFPVPGFTQAVDGYVWLRTCAVLPSGGGIAGNVRLEGYSTDRWSLDVQAGGYSSNATDSTDRSTGGGFASANIYDTLGYCPTAVVGTPSGPYVPAVLIMGDSFIDLYGTAANKYGGFIGDQLEQITASGGIHPYIDCGLSGNTLTGQAGSGTNKVNQVEALYTYADTMVVQTVVNDIRASYNYGQLLAAATTISGRALTLNPDIRLGICTCTPNTTSTNGWVNDAGQTGYFNASFGVGGSRDDWNSAARNSASSLRAMYQYVIDGSLAAESPTNARVWDNEGGIALTGDGLHPSNAYGGPRMTEAVNKVLFYPDDTTPPTATFAIGTGGTSLTVTFDKDMNQSAGTTGLTVAYNGGGSQTLLGWMWSSATSLLAVLPVAAKASDTVTVSYNTTTGGLVDLAVPANELATITNGSVTNNSTVTGSGGGGGSATTVSIGF